MTVLNISKRKIYKRRRDGQVAQGTGGSGYASSFSASGADASDPWLKLEVPRLDKIRIDENGNLLVPGNVIAFADMGGEYGTIFDNLPLASATSKGVAQFSDTFFTVVNGVVTINEGVTGLDEIALATYLTNNQYATQAWVLGKNYLTTHQSLTGYATEEWVTAKNYLTTHQDISAYAKTADVWTKTAVPNLNLVTVDANGNLLVPGNVIAFADMGEDYGSIFDYLPLASATSKGVAQFSAVYFNVINGIVSINAGAVIAAETDPTVPAHVKAITSTQVSNWNTAYAWGNHANLYSLLNHNHSQEDIATSMTINSSDANTSTWNKNGLILSLNGLGSTNYPSTYGHTISFQESTNGRLQQLFFQSSVTGMWIRNVNRDNGIFQNWERVYTTGYTPTYSDTGAEQAFSKNTAFNKNFGTASGTVAQGNHTHDYLPLAGGTLTGNLYTQYIVSKGDLSLQAVTGSTDSPDIIFRSGDGTELHRLYAGSNTLNYRTGTGTTYQMYHTGYKPSYSDVGAPSTTGTNASGTWAIAISGNASTATKLATTRNIALTGDVTGSVNFDGSANVSIVTAVGNDSHSHSNLSGIDSSRFIYGMNASGSNSQSATYSPFDLTQYKSGFWEVSGASWMPDTGWWWCMTTAHTSNSSTYNYSGQFAFRNASTPNVYVRTVGGGNPNAWQQLYHSGNSNALTVDWSARNINASGYITASGEITAYSDMRLKHREKPFDNVLQNVSGLNVFYYTRLDIKSDRLSIGVSAQQIQNKWSEFVLEGGDTTLLNGTVIHKTLSVAYDKLGTAIAIQGLKEVKYWMDSTDRWKSAKDKEIERLTQRVSELENQLKAA